MAWRKTHGKTEIRGVAHGMEEVRKIGGVERRETKKGCSLGENGGMEVVFVNVREEIGFRNDWKCRGCGGGGEG